jgi:uncharacterized protein (TIGR03663 family)
VGTASTKQGNRKKARSPQGSASRPPEQLPEVSPSLGPSRKVWLIASVVIILVAAFLRFYDLDLVPLHHDEGVNGNFLVRLVREGVYQYDPANYHGPTLYYFAAFFPRLLRKFFGQDAQNRLGLTTTAIRSIPAIFGLATVALILTLRKNLGSIATLVAAALLAISPGAVYLSRYFIHESQFVFFTLAMVVGALKYYERGNPIYLLLSAFSAGLLFATKETAIISVVVIVIACVLTVIYQKFRTPQAPKRTKSRDRRAPSQSGLDDSSFVERAGGRTNLLIWLLIAALIFLAVSVLFYSSFFHNFPKGVLDSIRTFAFWQKTGRDAHVHPLRTYMVWLLLQEAPLILLGALGAIAAVFRPAKSFALFAALWAFGLIAAYSLISYKTPWLALSFMVPLALSGGYAIEWLLTELKRLEAGRVLRLATVAVALLIVMGFVPGMAHGYAEDRIKFKTFIPGYQTIDLNFLNYDNDSSYYVYVYAHTRRDLLKMLGEIDRIAERTHERGQTGITIVSPEYWPLPWYLRNYTRVGYFGHMTQSTEPIIIAQDNQADEIQKTFGDRYQRVHSGINAEGSYSLRPGVDLLLFTRRELTK